MNSYRSSLGLPVLGSLSGGILGFASYLWLLNAYPAPAERKVFWIMLGMLFVLLLSASSGGLIGYSAQRIGQDLRSGGTVKPYLKIAAQYFAIGLIVLWVNGNRDPLDLMVLPCLSAVAGLVFSSVFHRFQSTTN